MTVSRSALVTPVGGALVNLLVPEEARAEVRARANRLPSIQLSERAVYDLELLATYLDGIPRLSRPHLWLHADGELALECPLPLDGRAPTADAPGLCDYAARRAQYFEGGWTSDTEGLVGELTVRENIILAMQAARGWIRPIPRRRQDELVSKYIAALQINPPNPDLAVRDLSGGNQQKVMLARWLITEPRLLILDEPTRGIDVGAKAEIQRLVVELSDGGMAVL